MLNGELLRSPLNWFTVLSMVVIGLFALHFGLALIHGQPVFQKHPSRVQ